jgi:hypothetical protein
MGNVIAKLVNKTRFTPESQGFLERDVIQHFPMIQSIVKTGFALPNCGDRDAPTAKFPPMANENAWQ